MGVSYWAVGGLRVMLDRDRLYRTVRVRSCAHPESGSFCPECGKPTWREAQEPIEGYLPEGTRESRGLPLLCGLACWPFDCDRSVLVAEKILRARQHGERSDYCVPEDHAATFQRMAALLEPLGLWRGAKFGFWVALDAS